MRFSKRQRFEASYGKSLRIILLFQSDLRMLGSPQGGSERKNHGKTGVLVSDGTLLGPFVVGSRTSHNRWQFYRLLIVSAAVAAVFATESSAVFMDNGLLADELPTMVALDQFCGNLQFRRGLETRDGHFDSVFCDLVNQVSDSDDNDDFQHRSVLSKTDGGPTWRFKLRPTVFNASYQYERLP
jgi:hypothetical protein